MPPNDPFLPLHNWRTSLFRGDKPAIDRFIHQLDVGLPTGWNRDLDYEQTRKYPERLRCYLFDQPGDASIRVWLQLVSSTRVRTGAVQLLRHPPQGQSARPGELVAEFTNSHVLLAATANGVRCSNPSFGPRSVVTFTVEKLFTLLADTADGEWPLHDYSQAAWDELISGCLAEQAAIDRSELKKWLADSGWAQEAAQELTERFFRDADWLAKRLEVAATW